MLMRSIEEPPTTTNRNPRPERRLWHDAAKNMAGLGCSQCREFQLCGGLRVNTAFFDCLRFCCDNPENCDRVCRKHPDFADRVREVGTFNLDNVPRAPALEIPVMPYVIPVIFHGKRRTAPISSEAVALSLYQMFDRRTGKPRFTEQNELCKAFVIEPGTTIVLTGTARDASVERWWGLGEEKRRKIIRALKSAGVGLITAPNYSLFLDRPRWDDLHAMKRIAIVHEEFLREGMPAGLHVNGRTETDFQRWTEYIAIRPEITHLAYEFTTGTGRSERFKHHATWLATLAQNVRRPLHLVVRGNMKAIPMLSNAFAQVSFLETSSFMKTVMRKRAYIRENGALTWQDSPTETGAPLDALLAHNISTVNNNLNNFLIPTNGTVQSSW